MMSRPLPKAAAGLDIERVTADSRQVRPGDLFVAIQGVVVDGRDFIPDAVRRGASAILAQSDTHWPPGVPRSLPSSALLGRLPWKRC